MINEMTQPNNPVNASDANSDARSFTGIIPGIICAKGKSVTEIKMLLLDMLTDAVSAVVTDAGEQCGTALVTAFPEGEYDPKAEVFIIRPEETVDGKVFIVTAGRDDLPAALEAKYTLTASGIESTILQTSGSADIAALAGLKERLRCAAACIAVAGTDNALPGIVAGATQAPVIALPVSTAGKNIFGGWLSLLGNLGSGAAGLTVVGIDNGSGAGFAAARIINSRNAK